MLDGKVYRALDKELPFVAAFIARSKEHKTIAFITMVPSPYSEILAEVRGDIEQQEWGQNELGSL